MTLLETSDADLEIENHRKPAAVFLCGTGRLGELQRSFGALIRTSATRPDNSRNRRIRGGIRGAAVLNPNDIAIFIDLARPVIEHWLWLLFISVVPKFMSRFLLGLAAIIRAAGQVRAEWRKFRCGMRFKQSPRHK